MYRAGRTATGPTEEIVRLDPRHRRPHPLVALGAAALLAAPVAASAQGEQYKPTDTVGYALSAQITDNGFNALESIANAQLPALIADLGVLEVPDITSGINLKGVKLNIKSVDLDIKPVTPAFAGATLELYLDMVIGLNSQSEPYRISVPLLCNSEGDGWVESLTVTTPPAKGGIPLEISVVDGAFQIDLEIKSNSLELRNMNAKGNCGGTLNFATTALQSVIINALLVPEINKLLKGTPTEPGLLADLNESLGAASIALVEDSALELLGKELNVVLDPRQAFSSPAGLELVYDSHIYAAQDPCVANIDPLGSRKTPPREPPAIGGLPPATQVAALVSDDMVNQALYAVFSGGLLCIDVDEELLGSSAGLIPKGAALIGLLAGNDLKPEFDAILPPNPPTLLTVSPTRVPLVAYDRAVAPIAVDIEQLNLNVFTEIDGRTARVLALGVDTEVGVDLDFDDTTGALAIQLFGLDADSLQMSFAGDEFVAGTGPAIARNAQKALGGILEVALPSLLGSNLSFTLPSFAGIGLTSLVAAPSARSSDWLQATIQLGTVTYGDPDAGCGGSGGCGGGSGGCGGSSCGGCSNGPSPLGAYLLVLMPVVALRRRRT